MTPEGLATAVSSFREATKAAGFLARQDTERIRAQRAHRDSMVWGMDDDYFDESSDAHIRPSGIGILPINGALFTKGFWCYRGYDDIARAGRSMLASRGVDTIVMPIDSPGGACAGLREVCAEIRSWREHVKVYTVADFSVSSAATAILAQGTMAFTSPGAAVGHIGTWSDWYDITGNMREQGVRHGYISQGALKTFFAEDDTETGTEEQDIKRMQVMGPLVLNYYRLLLADVAAGRGSRMTVEMAQATEAGIYPGDQPASDGLTAITSGLCDGLATFEDLIYSLENIQSTQQEVA